MSLLHVESQGSGAPLLLIHGWGMHGGMWGQVATQLAQTHRVYSVDLPGHGASVTTAPYQLDALVAQLSARFTEPLTVCGWSLGGQIALRWAQLHPAQINKLILVATTPCFAQRVDWECAMPSDTLQEFATALLQNYSLTLRRFLALQVRGSEQERELLVALRAQLFSHGEPNVEALKGGLEILRDTDLRASLAQVLQPTLLLAGERDTLTPLAAMKYLRDTMPDARLEAIKGAAHAPFLSHQDEFLKHLMRFMEEV